MGEVKTFFDLIVERGMVFVTYVRFLRSLLYDNRDEVVDV